MMTQLVNPDPGCQQSKFQDPDPRVWVLRCRLLQLKSSEANQRQNTLTRTEIHFLSKTSNCEENNLVGKFY